MVRGWRYIYCALELRGVHYGVLLCAREHCGPHEPVRSGLRVRESDGEHATGGMPRGPLLPDRVHRGHAVPRELLLARRPVVHFAGELPGLPDGHVNDGRRSVIVLAADDGSVGCECVNRRQFRWPSVYMRCSKLLLWHDGVPRGLLRALSGCVGHLAVFLDNLPAVDHCAHDGRVRNLHLRDRHYLNEHPFSTSVSDVDKLHRMVLVHVDFEHELQQCQGVCLRAAWSDGSHAHGLLCQLHNEPGGHRDRLHGLHGRLDSRDRVAGVAALIDSDVLLIHAEHGHAI